ncbi:MAG: ribbon-helix-helix protein, CopG family [Armatimonadetes bacterium]|nr:ribbon-helix-helix protein, CopG family [Armatimonadota bacterium]
MFGPKVKLDRELYERLQRCAEAAGYSSTDEFIRHTLEKAAAVIEEADSEEEIKKRLQGLGYLD